jgi:hypothetical protein
METLVPRHVLIDDRYRESRAFAASAVRLGMKLHITHGDFTDFWYEQLDRQWRIEPFAIAGLTSPAALFVLGQLARPYGHVELLKVEHNAASDGTMAHSVSVPAAAAAMLMRELPRSTPEWPTLMAKLVSCCPIYDVAPVPCRIHVASSRLLEEPLVTWVLAPKNRISQSESAV